MVHTSFSFLFSSSSSYYRLVIILILNPLPFLYGVPIEKTDINSKFQRQKRQINFNNADLMINKNGFIQKEKLIFEGLLGLTHFYIIYN